MRGLAAFLLLLLLSSAAQAQFTVRCGSFDTNSNSSAQLPTLGICNLTTGPNGIIFATANSEQSCSTGSTMGVQLFVGSGTSPITGSNFSGNISSAGHLTVTSIVNGFGYGGLITSGLSITTAGGGGPAGPITYTAVATSGGLGINGTVDVTVTGGSVTQVLAHDVIAGFSIGYHVGDVLSVAAGSIGGTSGFTFTVTAIRTSPWIIQAGQTLTGPGYSKQTATIVSQASSSMPGGDTGMLGVYNISDATVTGTEPNGFTLPSILGGMTAISPLLHATGCSAGYLTTSIAGGFTGTPNSNYYLLVGINTDTNGNIAKWNNSGIAILTW